MFVESFIGLTIVISVLANLSATLYNGYKTRKSSDEQREKQEQFQLRLQKNQQEETARLQRELKKIGSNEIKYNHDCTLSHQQEQSKIKNLLSTWPLLLEPLSQLDRLEKLKIKGKKAPLQIFIVEDASLTLPNYREFYETIRNIEHICVQRMSSYFNRNGTEPVELHTQSLKYPSTFIGESHIANIHALFGNIPTVILNIRINRGVFIMESAYWGWSNYSEPQFSHFAELDLNYYRKNIHDLQEKHIDTNLELSIFLEFLLILLLVIISNSYYNLNNNTHICKLIKEYEVKSSIFDESFKQFDLITERKTSMMEHITFFSKLIKKALGDMRNKLLVTK